MRHSVDVANDEVIIIVVLLQERGSLSWRNVIMADVIII